MCACCFAIRIRRVVVAIRTLRSVVVFRETSRRRKQASFPVDNANPLSPLHRTLEYCRRPYSTVTFRQDISTCLLVEHLHHSPILAGVCAVYLKNVILKSVRSAFRNQAILERPFFARKRPVRLYNLCLHTIVDRRYGSRPRRRPRKPYIKLRRHR